MSTPVLDIASDNRPTHEWAPYAVLVPAAGAIVLWLVCASRVGVAPRLLLELLALVGWGAVMLAARRRALPLRAVWVTAVVLAVVAIAVAPIGSRDVWAFVMQGRIVAVHHASPYIHRPSAYPHDPFLRLVAPGWRHSRSPYGPLFTAVSGVLSLVGGNSPLANRVAYQALAALALGAAAWGQQRRNNPLGVVFLLLNPMTIAIVNGGHGDIAVGAFLAAAVHTAQRHGVGLRSHPRRSAAIVGLLLAAAVLIKLPSAVAVVAVVVWLLRNRGRTSACVAGAVGATTVIASYVAAGGRTAVLPLLHGGTRISRASAAGLVNQYVGSAVISAGTAARAGALLTVVGVGIVVWRSTSRFGSPARAATASVVVLFLSAPYVLPWYLGMALPLAADEPETAATRTAAVLAAGLWLAYTEAPGQGHSALSARLNWLPVTATALAAIVVVVVRVRSSRSGRRRPA